MSELKRWLVLVVSFIAFILGAYIQAGGTWRGPHNLRKSLPSRGATIGMEAVTAVKGMVALPPAGLADAAALRGEEQTVVRSNLRNSYKINATLGHLAALQAH